MSRTPPNTARKEPIHQVVDYLVGRDKRRGYGSSIINLTLLLHEDQRLIFQLPQSLARELGQIIYQFSMGADKKLQAIERKKLDRIGGHLC